MKRIICTECPVGCEIEVDIVDGEVVSVFGNGCPRGKNYAVAEVLSPERVVTTTVRSNTGIMIPVKTSKPVKKEDIFSVVKKANSLRVDLPVRIGQVLIKEVSGDADLIVTANINFLA